MRKEVEKDLKIYTKKWSIRDLNPWPPHCQCGALPTALMPHEKSITQTAAPCKGGKGQISQ